MISNPPIKILRSQVNWQIWFAFSLLAAFGLLVALGAVYSLVQRMNIDKEFEAHGRTATGVITDLERQAGSRGLRNWHPKVEFIVGNTAKHEMIDRDTDIAGNVNQGDSLKQQFLGRKVQVEYLPDLSVVRVVSSRAVDRANQIGYYLLFIAISILLFVPLALAWWRPHWVIPKKESSC